MQFELERRHDAEIAATAADGPEKVGVLHRARLNERAVGGHHIGGDQIVHREPEFSAEPPEAATECEPCDPRSRVDAERRGKTEGLRLFVELAERDAGLNPRGLLLRVDADGAHRRQVDKEPALANRVAGNVVATAAHRHEQTVVAGKTHRPHHVACTAAAHDRARPAVDHGVPDRPRLVVTGFVRQT